MYVCSGFPCAMQFLTQAISTGRKRAIACSSKKRTKKPFIAEIEARICPRHSVNCLTLFELGYYPLKTSSRSACSQKARQYPFVRERLLPALASTKFTHCRRSRTAFNVPFNPVAAFSVLVLREMRFMCLCDASFRILLFARCGILSVSFDKFRSILKHRLTHSTKKNKFRTLLKLICKNTLRTPTSSLI